MIHPNHKYSLLTEKQKAEIIELYRIYKSAGKVAREFSKKHEMKIQEFIVYKVLRMNEVPVNLRGTEASNQP